MSNPQPPIAAVEATERFLEPTSHPIPCDSATAAAIANDVGYLCSPEWVAAGQQIGFLPTTEEWGYRELTVLLCSLEFRQRWAPGHFDERKNQARLCLERQDLSLVSAELHATMKFDVEFLLASLQRGDLTETERNCVCETIRWRMMQVEVDA